MKDRVLSGIRATGRLHLGNYLGAVRGMLDLQDSSEYETFYMVADAHTITTPYDIEELRKNRREVILDYLAAGLDPEKSVLFIQSEVSEHFELAFYLSSVTTVAKMQHLATFKDKVKQYPQNVTMALLNYPLLMSADILAYKAHLVPVGKDQEPHLEVAREVARRMNQDYSTDFPEPERFKTEGEYVPSLTGEGKMSKSIGGSYINLSDDLETIRKKIAKIPTDEGYGVVGFENGKKRYISLKRIPQGVGNLASDDTQQVEQGQNIFLEFVKLFLPAKRVVEIEEEFKNKNGELKYAVLKAEVSEAIYNELNPIQEKRRELENNSEYVDKVISDGNEKARNVARETVKEVREKMGLK